MTHENTRQQLLDLLIPIPNQPWCTTHDCTTCEAPHLREQLEHYQATHGADTLDHNLTEIFRSLHTQPTPSARPAHVSGIFQILNHTPDLAPRPMLAHVQLRRLVNKIRQRSSHGVASELTRILPCWPELCAAIARGLHNSNEVTARTVKLLCEQAAALNLDEMEVQA
jgi:hypothetical protein